MTEAIVYLVSSEDKDRYCLTPLRDSLSQHFTKIRQIDLGSLTQDEHLLSEMCDATLPVFIFNSRISIEYISLIMGSRPYISIGTEHGIGPFKRYTYGSHLLKCDIYFAPTKLWADRLIKLYTPPKSSVQIGGYQRLHNFQQEIKEIRQSELVSQPNYWPGVQDGKRKLVIFSWHLDPNELSKLPDSEDIVYLAHPADSHIIDKVHFTRAAFVVSNPNDTVRLLAHADVVAGDFSSMTIEAAATGLPTYFFVARSLYKSNCDMGADFFEKKHPNFAKIPYSDFQIPRNQVCDREQLETLLRSTDPLNATTASPLDSDSDLLPPPDRGDGQYIASAIKSYISYILSIGQLELRSGKDNRDSLTFIKNAYQAILGRPADFAGALHYLSKLISPSDIRVANAASIISDLANSQEARSKWRDNNHLPKLF